VKACVSMSNCSQIFSEKALLQKVQELAQSMSELRDLRRWVREAEMRARGGAVTRSASKTETAFDGFQCEAAAKFAGPEKHIFSNRPPVARRTTRLSH
jgi:hypothetical protein